MDTHVTNGTVYFMHPGDTKRSKSHLSLNLAKSLHKANIEYPPHIPS